MIDLTPLEVRKKKGDFRRTMRGYEPALVDDFLDLVADRLDELVRENMALAERAAGQDQQVAEYRERERALTEALVTAQQVREEIRQQTSREAEQVRRAVEQETDQLRARTDAHVAELRAAAEREAAGLRAAAEEHAARIRRAAEQEAGELRAAAVEEASRIREAAEQEAAEIRASAASAADDGPRAEEHPARVPITGDRAREQEAIQRLRARHEQFLGSYRAFLEKELAELEGAAATIVAGVAESTGIEAQPPVSEPLESESLEPEATSPASEASQVPESLESLEPEPLEAEPLEPEAMQLPESFASTESLDLPQPPASEDEISPSGPATPLSSVEAPAAPRLDELSFELERSWPAPELEALGVSGAAQDTAGEEVTHEGEPEAGFEDLDLDDDLVLPELDVEPLEPFAPEPYEPVEQLESLRADVGVQPDDAVHALEASLPEVEPSGFERDPIAEAVEEEIASLTDAVGPSISPWGLFDEPPPDQQAGPELYDAIAPDETDDGVPGPIGLTPLGTETPDWRSPPELALGFQVVDTEGSDSAAHPAPAAGPPGAATTGGGAPPGAHGAAGPEPADQPVEDVPDEETDLLLRNAAAAGYQVPDDDELLLEDVLEDDDEADDDGWLPSLLEDER